MGSDEYRWGIAFFDLEATERAIYEFGVILLCPQRLTEIHSYSTPVKPVDPYLVSVPPGMSKRITQDEIDSAPTFPEIADKVYDFLHGRIWAGHNIRRWDCRRIREEFEKIDHPPPKPLRIIDSLHLLTHKKSFGGDDEGHWPYEHFLNIKKRKRSFGWRAGKMKLATLANYFKLGRPTHRSLDDARMNIEILKNCSMVLLLESSLPAALIPNSWVSSNDTTRSHIPGNFSLVETNLNMNTPTSDIDFGNDTGLSSTDENIGVEVLNPVESNIDQLAPFEIESLQPDTTMEERPVPVSLETSSNAAVHEGSDGYAGFLEPHEVSIPLISASLVPSYPGSQRIQLLHDNCPLQLYCTRLRVHSGRISQFPDNAGRPRFSIMVDPSPSLWKVLDVCENLVNWLSVDSGGRSEWRPVVTTNNSSTIRLHLPSTNRDFAIYATEIYQNDASGNAPMSDFSRFNAAELYSLFVSGTMVDAYFSLDVYDYQQYAGIRLVANKLIIHPN